MRSLLVTLLFLIFCKDASSVSTNNKKEQIKNSSIDDSTEKVYEIREKNIPINATGSFHFFWSTTSQDKIYAPSDSRVRGETEGSINFLYKNNISDSLNYSFNINLFKKFNNTLRLREILEIENQSIGKIQISNYRKIQDDLFVNTYWIKKGSNGAFDRSLNLSLTSEESRNANITNIAMTEYDTAMLHSSDTDSASVAIYKNFLDKKLTLGASYTPKTYNNYVKNQFANYKNIITLGAMYQAEVSDHLKVKFSTLGEHGVPAAQPEGLREGLVLAKLNAINFGTMIEYNNLSIAGSFGIWGKSNHLKNVATNAKDVVPSKDSYYFDVATSYNINEKAGISLSYFKSLSSQNYSLDDKFNSPENPELIHAGQSEFQNISLAIDYKIFEDLVIPYAEINKFIVKDNNGLSEVDKRKDNIGWVFVLGAKSKF